MKKYLFLMSFLLLCRSIYAEDYIDGYEYWMDNDYAGSTFVSTTGNPTTLSINEAIDATMLPEGLHWFHIRFLDSEGRWSIVQSKSFLKGNINEYWENGNNKIAAYEYWIDGNYATSILVNISPENQFILTASPDFSLLPDGLHWFHIRFQDTEGNWSLTQSKSFLIQDISTPWSNENNVLMEYEYWLDNDYANKQGGTINSVKTFTLVTQIDYSGLNEGLHHFHIRFRDSEGKWSTAQSKLFYIPDLLEYWNKPDNKITAYSYWFDNDNTASINVNLPSPVNPYSLVAKIDVPVFEANTTHTFSIKFKDTEEMWSPVRSTEFTINSKPLADAGLDEINLMLGETFNFSGIASDNDGDPITQHEWTVVTAPSSSTISGIIATSASFSFIPDFFGDFVLSYRVFGGNAWSDPDFVTVHVFSNRPPIAECQDMEVPALGDCSADASIDNGSYDPDDDAITITQTPAGPYPIGTTAVTLRATDPDGLSSECTANVIVTGEEITSVDIDVDPEYPVSGEGRYTIYIGYGEQTVTLTALTNDDANGSFTYSWKLDGTEVSNSQSYDFTPSAQGTYDFEVTVTNEHGCTFTSTVPVTIVVYDWRCGNNNDKVRICHNGREICISQNAVQEHLDHGDVLGECTDDKRGEHGHNEELYTTTEGSDITLIIKQNSPNPFSHLTEIQYFVSKSEQITLTLSDIDGREIARLADGNVPKGWNTIMYDGSNLASGTYILRLEASGNSVISKIVKTE